MQFRQQHCSFGDEGFKDFGEGILRAILLVARNLIDQGNDAGTRESSDEDFAVRSDMLLMIVELAAFLAASTASQMSVSNVAS
jgi:hypothetical protein